VQAVLSGPLCGPAFFVRLIGGKTGNAALLDVVLIL
jgi:hypothetical protein